MTKIDQKKKLSFIIAVVIVSLFLLIYPYFGGQYWTHIFIFLFLNITLAMGYRLLYVTGLGSFCHVTFFGIGAYASGLLSIKLGLPFGASFLAAGIAAAASAVLIGWPAVKAKGPYFFLISFGFWAVIDSVFRHWNSLTGGPGGLKGIPPIMEFTTVAPYYYIALIFTALTIFIMYRLDRTRFGAELYAIGDADDLAEITGINVVGHRVLAFAIGAFFAGLAGSIYAHYMRFIAPSSFSMWVTIYILVWCVLGGERKVWGPIAGAILLTLSAEILRMSGTMQAILYAALLLAVVMVMPKGIAGLVDTIQARRREGIGAITEDGELTTGD